MYVHALNVHRLNNFPAIIADIYLICQNKIFNYGKGIILKTAYQCKSESFWWLISYRQYVIIPKKLEKVICFCDGFKICSLIIYNTITVNYPLSKANGLPASSTS